MGYARTYCYECVPETVTVKTGAEMRKIVKLWVIEEKGGKCQLCGYNKCIEALDLHHLDPSKKEFNISSRDLRYSDWPIIKKEIENGVLVCSNCHREIHAGFHPEFIIGKEKEK